MSPAGGLVMLDFGDRAAVVAGDHGDTAHYLTINTASVAAPCRNMGTALYATLAKPCVVRALVGAAVFHIKIDDVAND